MVRAPAWVGTFSTSENLVGESSCTTLMVPVSPLEAKAKPVAGSNRSASTPSPIGTVAITLPLAVLEMAIMLLSQPENSRPWAASIAMPDGDWQGASDQLFPTVSLAASKDTIWLLSSTLT